MRILRLSAACICPSPGVNLGVRKSGPTAIAAPVNLVAALVQAVSRPSITEPLPNRSLLPEFEPTRLALRDAQLAGFLWCVTELSPPRRLPCWLEYPLKGHFRAMGLSSTKVSRSKFAYHPSGKVPIPWARPSFLRSGRAATPPVAM